jgi:tRNA wybutosine-synthesizing protein 1
LVSNGDNYELVNLADYDEDALALEDTVVFLVATHTEGTPPPSCTQFFKFVEDATTDFRYGATALSKVKFAVFGVGNADYAKKDYCTPAKRLDKWLTKLGAQRICAVGLGNDSEDLYEQLKAWSQPVITGQISPVIATLPVTKTKPVVLTIKANKKEEEEEADSCGASDDEDMEDDSMNEEDMVNGALVDSEEPILDDVEDLQIVPTSTAKDGKAPAEMVTPLQRKNLTKQGYKLIGSHSAVKLCRWTKAQVRGRGGCYKHTFYGINSHQCMEATPSLACANKCVFCWRTHTNPVGREWRWKTDDPGFIVASAVSEHLQMTKSLRGIQGALPERIKEAQTIRHCALSLVGEPIMYPRINELVKELHDRQISSFLVTNAQFPQAIRDLNPVTQLYVSVDASTKDALKAIDRPLFSDFWERFQDSLAAIREINGRTVFRLTLVNDRNVGSEEDLEGYARLVISSKPDLIEIKGVTFCGKSNASDLTMKDVPWHHEVRNFSQQLCDRVKELSPNADEYGMACEHAHSVCVLLARKDKYLVNDEWHTWIDFDRFQELEREWRATGRRFDAREYRLKTPAWALYGAAEEGFDPEEKRFVKTRNTAVKKAAAAAAGLLANTADELLDEIEKD